MPRAAVVVAMDARDIAGDGGAVDDAILRLGGHGRRGDGKGSGDEEEQFHKGPFHNMTWLPNALDVMTLHRVDG
jgi:hypothetical protein